MKHIRSDPNYEPIRLRDEQINEYYKKKAAKDKLIAKCNKALLHEALQEELPREQDWD